MTAPWAVLLDRDGTVMVDAGYLADPAGVRLLPGAGEAMAALTRAGVKLLIVSNQSGVGRGYFDEASVWAVDAELRRQLARHGAAVDGSYYCLHAPADGCRCRKPAPGLLQQALSEHEVHPSDAVLVGDRPSDLAAAAALGIAAHSIVETTWPTLVDKLLPALAPSTAPAGSPSPGCLAATDVDTDTGTAKVTDTNGPADLGGLAATNVRTAGSTSAAPPPTGSPALVVAARDRGRAL